MHTEKKKKSNVWVWVLAVVILIFVMTMFGETEIHNVVCITNNFYKTPNEALIKFQEEDAERIGVDENTPAYVLKVDECNAVVCFVCEEGVSAELMYTKNNGYHNLGWGTFYPYHRGNTENENDPASIPFLPGKLIRKSGFYSGDFEYAVVQYVVDESDEQHILTFPVGTETWTIVSRAKDT